MLLHIGSLRAGLALQHSGMFSAALPLGSNEFQVLEKSLLGIAFSNCIYNQ
jgi:hypothetical protein